MIAGLNSSQTQRRMLQA